MQGAPTENISLAELLDFTGKTALITGASQGIGAGIARRYHEAGANISIADLNDEKAQEVADELNAKRPDSAVVFKADVTNADEARSIVNSTIEKFGNVDVLVANAGVFPMKPVADMESDMLRKVFDINVVGVHNYLQPVVAHMKETGKAGKIVITLSIDALRPSASVLSAYDASKHGLYGYMKAAALEFAGDGIQINGLAPGGILTEGVLGGADAKALIDNASAPLGRWGFADDMALSALFLGSGLNSYATGSLFVSDGGTQWNS